MSRPAPAPGAPLRLTAEQAARLVRAYTVLLGPPPWGRPVPLAAPAEVRR